MKNQDLVRIICACSKSILLLLTISFCPNLMQDVIGQEVEIQGKAKVSKMSDGTGIDSVVVRMPDSTLGIRSAASLAGPVQTLEISAINDTLRLSESNFVIIPGISIANYTAQDVLDAGYSPCEAIEAGYALNSLYGLKYQGGYIFYFLNSTVGLCSGFVAALSDQADSTAWGCSTTSTPGTNPGIGQGVTNTNLILAANCSSPTDAVQLAADYDDGTYDDWFLPSIDELREMYQKLKLNGIGDLNEVQYWSSYTTNLFGGGGQYIARGLIFNVCMCGLGLGDADDDLRTTLNAVRAIRKFD